MIDVRGDVLRPPHSTTPAAVKVNKSYLKLMTLDKNQRIVLISGTCISQCTHLVYYIYQV